jgi:hypothetical protein
MRTLTFIALASFSLLAACVGPEDPPALESPPAAPVSANVTDVGAGQKNLGTTFTQPPSEIGNGDGFAPQPFVNGDGNPAVMVVAHHNTGLNIGSLDLYTAQKITPITLAANVNTSNGFGYVQDLNTKRFYVPTSTSAGVFTYSCINGNFKPSLNEQPTLCQEVTPVSGTLASAGSSLSADGLVISNGAIYGAMGTSNGLLIVTCASVSNVNCAGYPKTIAADYQPGSNNVRLQDLGEGKIAVGFNRTANSKVSAICFDLTSQSICARVDSQATGLTSQPMGWFDGKTLQGFCAFSIEAMSQTACVDFAGQARPVNVTVGNMSSPMYGMVTRMPGTGKYMVTSLGGNNIECIDMALGGQSCGSTPKFTGTIVSPYGSAFHFNTSTGDMCLLTYNDAKKLGIFRVNTTTGQLTEDLRCFAPGGVSATWRVADPVPKVCPRAKGTRWESASITTGNLTLDGAASAEVLGGDVTVTQVGSGQILARQVFAQAGLPISVSLSALGIQYENNPSLDIQIRLLQSNGFELRAGYQMTAKLDVKLVCGP